MLPPHLLLLLRPVLLPVLLLHLQLEQGRLHMQVVTLSSPAGDWARDLSGSVRWRDGSSTRPDVYQGQKLSMGPMDEFGLAVRASDRNPLGSDG